MKKSLFIFLLSACLLNVANAQKFFTKTGRIDFNATAPSSPENIQAVNRTVTCVLYAANGNMQFAVLIKGFTFERKLMQEHFNENYMESDKFPKASFKGQITNLSAIQFSKDGEYKADVKGKLTIHGVTKDVSYSGKIIIRSGKLILASSYSVLLADYNIAIPGPVKDKVAKEVKINVQVSLDQMK